MLMLYANTFQTGAIDPEPISMEATISQSTGASDRAIFETEAQEKGDSDFEVVMLSGEKFELPRNNLTEEALEKIKNLQNRETCFILIDDDPFYIVGSEDRLLKYLVAVPDPEEGELLNHLFAAYYFSKKSPMTETRSQLIIPTRKRSTKEVLSIEELKDISALTKSDNLIDMIEEYEIIQEYRTENEGKFMVCEKFINAVENSMEYCPGPNVREIWGDWLEAIVSTSLTGINKEKNRSHDEIVYLLEDQMKKIGSKAIINFLLTEIAGDLASIAGIDKFRDCLSKAFQNFLLQK